MIRLIKSTFFNEEDTKEKLCKFLMSSDKLSMGDKCLEFERGFSTYQGIKYSVLFNSGSSANLAMVQALLNMKRLKAGDKVGFSALTWATNAMPLIQLGLDPVPVDVSLENLNVNSENLLDALEKHDLNAFFVTNLLGFCGDLDAIAKICKEKGIIFLEDNCESMGSELKDIKLGNFGLASSFSFFVGHHMSTVEGGMVCTDDKELFNHLIMARAHGWSRNLDEEYRKKLRKGKKIDEFYDKYTFYVCGFNLRPTEVTGFIGIEQLKYIKKIIQIRNHNFLDFHKAAGKNPDFQKLDLGHMSLVSNFAYPLVCKDKKTFEKYKKLFTQNNIEIRPIVGGSIVEQPFFQDYLKENGLSYKCPNAKRIHELGFYFPNNPELEKEERDLICSLLGA